MTPTNKLNYLVYPEATVEKVRLKAWDACNGHIKLLEQAGSICDVIHTDPEDTLNSVEHIFNWAIHRIVWSTENKPVPSSEDNGCHLNIMM